jgi:DNA modification methylase
VSKIHLSDQEKEIIAKCINENVEFPLEIVKKIAPGFFDKLAQAGEFDYRRLDKYKIPILDYEGKRSEPAILASASLLGESSPLQILRYFDGKEFKHNGDSQEEIFDIIEKQKRGEDDWRNLIVQGDNLLFLKACYLNQDPLIKDKVKGKVKLVYIDPPFGTGDEYGAGDGIMSYSAKLAGSEYVEALRERLLFLRELLSEDGSIFVRIDYHFGHYVKIIMDEVFEKNNFRNEIIIRRGYVPKGKTSQFPTATDSVIFYSKSPSFVLNQNTKPIEDEERRWISLDMPGERKNRDIRPRVFLGKTLYPPKGQHWGLAQDRISELDVQGDIRINERRSYIDTEGNKIVGMPEYLKEPFVLLNSNWTDIKSYETHNTFYPTENSEILLERIMNGSTQENDLVLDVFGGSGTTAAVAEKLGRRWITGDFGKHSIYTMQKRILTIADSKKLSSNESKGDKYGKNAKPFIIASVGSFDFSRIVNLRQHKEAYINFILTLFNIQERSSEELAKYKLPNIYGLKDGDPVEIYPIWEDDYLKNIKIDKEYLKGLAEAEGGKLKGNYYIIAPEICDRVGDWDYRTSQGNTVSFKILSYPYKILEEISRSQQLSEQPGSSSEINKLISSTRFYFNQEVTCKLKWHPQGLVISDLETAITDKAGNEIQGLDALAMVLIDKNFDGKMFTMEAAVYRKDIKDDGIIKVDKLTDKVAVIVIDRHGNESKIMILEK